MVEERRREGLRCSFAVVDGDDRHLLGEVLVEVLADWVGLGLSFRGQRSLHIGDPARSFSGISHLMGLYGQAELDELRC